MDETKPCREKTVHAAVSGLDNAVEHLTRTVNELEDNLSAVLHTESAHADEDKKDPSASCDLESRISKIERSVHDVRRQIESLSERLEV
jgi:hypothetical protein